MRLAVVLDEELPPGLAANAAAILGMSLGRSAPETLGPDVPDAEGALHPGITSLPVPVLAAKAEALRELRDAARAVPGIGFADFTELARRTRTYEEYARRLSESGSGDLHYLGICLYGDDESVRRLTGSLPLFGRSRGA